MKSWLQAIGDWFDARLGVREVFLPMMRHPVPRQLEGGEGWFYVFGSASLTFFLIQIVTGIGLALVYVPTTNSRSVGTCGRSTTTPAPAWS
jgi:ubiquinol-cytochrome c reductase cytochrome b subunit